MDLSSNNVIVEDSLQTSEENTTLTQTNDDETVSAESGSQILSEGEGTYYDLINEIGDGGDKSLTKSYYSYTGGNTIEITKSGVINGNGAVIDMAGSTIRAFYVNSSGVTIRNLTIKNANFNGDGGAIYFGVAGTVENCTFMGNKANGGGAMYEGYAINCRFIENHANSGYGGAINGYNHKSINCTFTSNAASANGGALSGGEAHNCSFISNVANNGGAINDGKIYNCNFTDNHANKNGGAMYGGTSVFNNFKTASDTIYNTNLPTFTVSKSYFIFDSDDKLLFNLTYDNKNYDGYNTTITITKDGNPVGVYYALSGSDEGWSADLSPGIYKATLSMEQYYVKPITVEIITGMNVGTYSELSREIASGGGIINLQYGYYVYDYGSSIEITTPNTVINGNGAIINMEGSTIRAFKVSASGVTIKNLTIKNANYNGDGGAIYFSSSATVTNCNFTNNQATGTNSWGGAIMFRGSGNVTNCNFIDNKATGDGGAVYFNDKSTVTNCNFADNTATYGGGAIYFLDQGTVTNCNFTGNTANNGGAIEFDGTGNVTNCNFTANQATINGGAVYSYYECYVTNCNFTDNSASRYGGAVYFSNNGDVANCNFINNKATGTDSWGGAVYFVNNGEVTNCNFTNNQATGTNSWGGAIMFLGTGNVTNCNFTGNNATTGSAIFFYKWDSSDTLTVSDSTFLNNRANSAALEVTKNDNNITITFTGNDNLLNAIYSNGEVSFTNVTYWSADGIANTDSSTPSRSNREAGQNMTIVGVVNGNIINTINATDADGKIVLNINAGDNYYITARHDTDSYYTEAERTISNNTKFNVNVTSQTTNNKTVNITAKSNIYSEVIPGKLLFILPNSTQINANYAGNGTWWAVHNFDDYAVYQVNASYDGLNNVTVSNAKITINKADSTITLDNITLNYGERKNVTVTTQGAVGITADINGINATVINNYTIQINDLAAGNYTLTVTTIPDGDHNPVTATSKITVNKIESTLTVNDIELDYGDSINVTVTALGATGITAKIDNVNVTVKGYIIPISGLDVGTYTLTVTTIADANHNPVTRNATITVNKAKTELTADAIITTYSVSKDLVITLKDSNGNPIGGLNITVDLNGTKNYTTDTSGQVKISTKGLAANIYEVLMTFNGTDNYLNCSNTTKVSIYKESSRVDTKPLTTDYNVHKYLVVGLKDNGGNPIRNADAFIEIHGVTYKCRSDDAGNARLIIRLNPGTYTAKITFDNVNYTGFTQYVTVIVKKLTPKLTAKSKKFKKSKKVKKYTVTLKDNNGKAMKKVKLTLKVKGKTYKAKTNAKGKAVFKIKNLKKKGKYTATVKFAGNNCYNKVTKKVKITIK